MPDDNRTFLTALLWFMSGIALTALFVSAAINAMTITHLVIALLIIAATAGGTYAAWNVQFKHEDQYIKAKREHIDDIIKDLSDDELMTLKKRLSDGEYSETSILDFMNEEGELVGRDERV